MASMDEYQSNNFASNAAAYVSREVTASPPYQAPKPSAIPRPSLHYSRPSDPAPGTPGRSSRSGSFQRTRTLSQPFPFDQPGVSGTSHSGQDSRSTSPMMPSVKTTTRIPMSRVRTGSMSSHVQPSLNGSVQTMRVDSRSGLNKTNGNPYQPQNELMPDLHPVNEAYPPSSVSSRVTLRTPRSQVSELVNEQAPFNANSLSSRSGYDTDHGPPRLSTESEERPFEHWYRGDVSRNGGVGELRVGRRQEMLDIANYGHSIREVPSRTALNNRSRSNSRGRDVKHAPVSYLKRSGSVGTRDRESLYLDQDEQLHQDTMVLDERPLTDLDTDEDGYGDEVGYYDDQHTERLGAFGLHDGTISPPLSLDRSDTPTTLVDNARPAAFKSRIPTPTPRQFSESSRTATPTQSPTLVTSDSSLAPKAYLSSQTPTPKLSPNDTGQGSTNNKRRAKSPSASAASSTKKSRTKSPAKPQPKKKEEARRSVAHYPSPEGDDIVHAIPSWTQPVPPSGNWDEVCEIALTPRNATN